MEAASRSTLPTLFTRLTLLVFNTVYTALQCKVYTAMTVACMPTYCILLETVRTLLEGPMGPGYGWSGVDSPDTVMTTRYRCCAVLKIVRTGIDLTPMG